MNKYFSNKKIFFLLLIIIINSFYISNAIINYYHLGSDSLNIASFVEGKRLGETYFKKDEILKDKRIYDWYTPFYLFVIEKLSLLFGNYYSVFWIQIIIFINIYLVGLILLSKQLFDNNILFEYLFVIINIVILRFKYIDIWAIPFKSARPQTFFISLLPIVFYLLFYLYKNNEKKISLLIVISGVLIYIHPVSAPYFISSLFVFYSIIALRKSISFSSFKKILITFTLIFLILMPYFVIYFNRYLSVIQNKIPSNLLYKIAHFRISKYYFDIPALYKYSYSHLSLFIKILLFFSLISIFYKFVSKKYNDFDFLFCVLYINLFIFSFLLPFSDQVIANKIGKFPFEIDFMRNIIFYPFIIYISSFYYLYKLFIYFSKRFKKLNFVYVFLLISFVSFFFYNNFLDLKSNIIFQRIKKGFFSLTKTYDSRLIDRVLIEKFTNVEDSIFYFGIRTGDIFIRPITKRSSVFSYKDGGVLLYSGLYDKLINWYENSKVIKIISNKIKRRKFLVPELDIERNILSISKNLDSDYLILNETNAYFLFENIPKVFCNGHIILSLKKDFIFNKDKTDHNILYNKRKFIYIKELNKKITFVKLIVMIKGDKKFYKMKFLNWSSINVDGTHFNFSNKIMLKTDRVYILNGIIFLPEDLNLKTQNDRKISLIDGENCEVNIKNVEINSYE